MRARRRRARLCELFRTRQALSRATHETQSLRQRVADLEATHCFRRRDETRYFPRTTRVKTRTFIEEKRGLLTQKGDFRSRLSGREESRRTLARGGDLAPSRRRGEGERRPSLSRPLEAEFTLPFGPRTRSALSLFRCASLSPRRGFSRRCHVATYDEARLVCETERGEALSGEPVSARRLVRNRGLVRRRRPLAAAPKRPRRSDDEPTTWCGGVPVRRGRSAAASQTD